MNTTLTKAIDHAAAARGQVTVSNLLPLAGLPRLREQLLEADGSVDARLRFTRDESGQTLISGELRTDLTLCCQRCLQPMHVAVDTRFRLGVVADDEQARTLPRDVEPLVTGETHVDPLVLIEDELLLSLPIVPRHEGDAPCEAPGAAADAEEIAQEMAEGRNPFAVLRKLSAD